MAADLVWVVSNVGHQVLGSLDDAQDFSFITITCSVNKPILCTPERDELTVGPSKDWVIRFHSRLVDTVEMGCHPSGGIVWFSREWDGEPATLVAGPGSLHLWDPPPEYADSCRR